MRFRIFAGFMTCMGFIALSSAFTYAAFNYYWWVEVTRMDLERGVILGLMHFACTIGGAIGFAFLMTETGSDRV